MNRRTMRLPHWLQIARQIFILFTGNASTDKAFKGTIQIIRKL